MQGQDVIQSLALLFGTDSNRFLQLFELIQKSDNCCLFGECLRSTSPKSISIGILNHDFNSWSLCVGFFLNMNIDYWLTNNSNMVSVFLKNYDIIFHFKFTIFTSVEVLVANIDFVFDQICLYKHQFIWSNRQLYEACLNQKKILVLQRLDHTFKDFTYCVDNDLKTIVMTNTLFPFDRKQRSQNLRNFRPFVIKRIEQPLEYFQIQDFKLIGIDKKTKHFIVTHPKLKHSLLFKHITISIRIFPKVQTYETNCSIIKIINNFKDNIHQNQYQFIAVIECVQSNLLHYCKILKINNQYLPISISNISLWTKKIIRTTQQYLNLHIPILFQEPNAKKQKKII